MRYRTPNKFVVYLIIFILLLIIIMLLKQTRFNFIANSVSNTQKKTTASFSYISDSLGSVKYIFSAKSDIEKMKQEALVLQTENQALIAENKRLERLLELKNYKPHPYSPRCFASIIAANTDGMIYYYVIDRGRQDGVEEGDGIITGGFAVGRVIKVMDNTAQVQLLTDTKSSISVKTDRGRVAGILTGKGYNLCEMNYVPKEEDVKKDDVVITSSLGGSFPEGIPVGKVINIKKDMQGLSMFIEVRPFADVFKIEDVIIVKKR